MSRILPLALALAFVTLALPAAPALSLGDERPPIAAPVLFDGDESLRDSPLVSGGSGTAEAPYVIEGWTFVLAPTPEVLAPSVSPSVNGVPLGALAFKDVGSHVVVRGNRFVAPDAGPVDVPDVAVLPGGDATRFLATLPAIHAVGSPRLSIVGNSFEGVGGEDGAIRLQGDDPEAILVEGNSFRTRGRALLSLGVGVGFVGNVVDTRGPYAAGALITSAAGAVRVTDNLIAATGGWGVQVFVPGETASVEISRNVVSSGPGGISVSALPGVRANASVADNEVAVGGVCAHLAAEGIRFTGNQMRGCGVPFSMGFHARDLAIDTSNRVDGGATYYLHQARNVTIDAAGLPAGWLRVVDSENVTLRHFALPDSPTETTILGSARVTIEDSRFPKLSLEASDPVLRRVELGARSRVAFAGSAILEDVENRAREPGSGTSLYARGNATLRVTGGSFFGSISGLSLSSGSGCLDATIAGAQLSGGLGADVSIAELACGGVTLTGVAFDGDGMALLLGKLHDGTQVDARDLWWGHPSGPRVATNPPGEGQEIASFSRAALDHVLYDPWLTSAP